MISDVIFRMCSKNAFQNSEKDLKRFSEGREWGFGSVVVEFGVFGAPDFQPRGPQTL